MAVVSNLSKISVLMQLNNGVVDDKVKTLSVNLGSINLSRYDDQKAMNIANLLEQCSDKPVYQVRKTAVSILSNDN